MQKLQNALELFVQNSQSTPVDKLKGIEQNLYHLIVESSPLPTTYEKSLFKSFEDKDREKESYIQQITATVRRLQLLSQVVRFRRNGVIESAIQCLKDCNPQPTNVA